MLPSSGFYRATLGFTGATVQSGAAVVWCGGNGDGLTPAVIGTRIQAAISGSGIMTLIPNTITAATVTVKVGPDSTGPATVVPVGVTGGATPGSAPPSDVGRSWLIHKATAQGGRRGRGRMFFPGLTENNVDGAGNIAPAAVTAFQEEVTDFYELLQSNNIDMYLEHFDATEWQLINGRPRRVPIPGSAPNPNPVTGLTVESVTASQRRRVRR